jgi:hypothetical protein
MYSHGSPISWRLPRLGERLFPAIGKIQRGPKIVPVFSRQFEIIRVPRRAYFAVLWRVL